MIAAHVLGIEARGHRGRTDEIDEHHGQLAAFGVVVGGRFGAGGLRGGGRVGKLLRKLRDGRQQLPPMADGRHAEFLQVVSRQAGEDLAVDLIVTERRLVLAEPEAPQPVSYVHGRVSPRPDPHDPPERADCPALRSFPRPLPEVLQRRLGLFQVERVETLGEPAVDGREEIARLGAPAVIALKTREARRRAQLQRTRLFAGIVHVRAQDGVDARLPTSALSAVSFHHIGVEAQRLIDLRAGLMRTAAPLGDGLRRFRAEDLFDQVQRRTRPFEVLPGPLRVLVIRPRGRVDFFFGITLDLSGLALPKLMTCIASPRNVMTAT